MRWPGVLLLADSVSKRLVGFGGEAGGGVVYTAGVLAMLFVDRKSNALFGRRAGFSGEMGRAMTRMRGRSGGEVGVGCALFRLDPVNFVSCWSIFGGL